MAREAQPDAAPARSPSFRPGALIAEKYVVERLIGEGGLGVVVAARHVQLDQMVAIKYLRPKVLASQAVVERFVGEARLAAKIRSEHVARVYDVGTLPSGVPYIVMEYLSGMDLGRVLGATGPLPVWRAVDYVLQACEALAEAHAAGIVHRDIKPQNLFLTTSTGGAPLMKVLDFGISKIASARAEPQAGEPPQGGEAFGTPVYMSPEQLLASGDIDARTDVWAIGVVLYQLLAARLPFEGDSLPELCTAILSHEPAPLAALRPELPEGLRRSVEKCLAKEAADRFQSIPDLVRAIEPFAEASREQRVAHAIRTIDAADRGRPLTPVPDELLTRALRAAPVPSFPDDRWVATTSSGVASWAPPAAPAKPPRAKRGGPPVLAFVAAGAAVAVALAVLVAGSRSKDGVVEPMATPGQPAPVAAAAQKVAVPVAPDPSEQTAVTPPAPAAATPVAPLSAAVPSALPPVALVPSVAAPPPPAPHPGVPRGTLRPHAADPGASAAPAARDTSTRRGGGAKPSAPADPNAVLNPFD